MFKIALSYAAAFALFAVISSAQPAQPAAHVIGTVAAVDSANESVTVKQDKTGTEYVAELSSTKTILSVPPGTKPADLRKMAKRITADQIHPGDRIEIYYASAAAHGNTIEARAAVVMSARSLEAAHSAEAAAWQHSTPGVVASIDPSTHTLAVKVRTPEGNKPIMVTTTAATQFTKYSAENPRAPASAQWSDLQAGDVIRVIGDRSADGSAVTAQKVYIAPLQIPAVVVSVAPGGKALTVKDLRNKQKMVVAVNDRTHVRKLPAPVAQMLARRLNPSYRAGRHGQEQASEERGAATHKYGAAGGSGVQGGRSQAPAELSQIIERAPEIAINDLKPGDAVVISGAPATGQNSELLANTIIAGVEPIFESAPPRQGQSLGNWSLGMSPPPEE